MITTLNHQNTTKIVVTCKSEGNSDGAFGFLVSSFIPTEKSEKNFHCHGKRFAKENFRAPAWPSAKCYRGHQTGNPDQPVSNSLARSRGLPYNRVFKIEERGRLEERHGRRGPGSNIRCSRSSAAGKLS